MPNSVDELIAAFDVAKSRYTTCELIKESAAERTELVCDSGGKRYLRKYIAWDSDELHPYERLSGLDLPRIPKVYETERLGGVLMVVTEFLEGESLESALKRGPLGENGVLALLGYLELALTALHALPEGPVIHRDVNPANIMLASDGAYLVDFGIARSWRPGASSDTRLLGTEGYAAPEQFGFQQTDPRTDIYALAQTLRACLAGSALPSRSQTKVLDKASALNPADRYASVAAFAEAFRKASKRGNSRTSPQLEESGQARLAASSLRGLTERSASLRVLWRIWQVALTGLLVFWLFGAVISIWVNKEYNEIPAIITSTVLWFAIPYVVLANPLHATSQISWLQKKRYLKLGLILVACFVALILIAAIFPGMFSESA